VGAFLNPGERGDAEFRAHVVAHRPADDLSGKEIEDHGQVEPAFAGRDGRDKTSTRGRQRRGEVGRAR
jgi:hypothetical protein